MKVEKFYKVNERGNCIPYYKIGDKLYYIHHCAMYRSYVSTKVDYVVEEYKGRFGKGYRVLTHNPRSTTYCYCDYAIEVEE